MTASIDGQMRFAIASKRLLEVTWRMLDVPKIERCVVTEQTFTGSRGSPGQHHNEWEVLYARVE